MAQAPTVAVPVRVPLGWDIATRDSTLDKDALLVNCYVDTGKDGVVSIRRRPGTSLWLHPTGFPLVAGDVGQGIYQGQFGFVYYTFGKSTYEYHNPTTPLISWGTSEEVQYTQVMGGKPGVVVGNTANTYFIDATNTVTGPLHTIDSDYPTFKNPGFAYLDGSVYVMQTVYTSTDSGAKIWGSALNSVDQPTSWDPLDFITAQMTPEGGVYLTKQLGYVVALLDNGVEFFYDAGNATGSPLAPAENLYFGIGCANYHTIQRISETLIWVTTTRDVSYKVVLMENTRPNIISTPAIERILNSVDISSTSGTPPVIYSWHLITGGHTFYGITLKDKNMTLVYDLTEKMWYQWTDPDGNYLPFVSVTGGAGIPFLAQHESNGSIYVWDNQYAADYVLEAKYGFAPLKGDSIPITIRTPRWDGGTTRNKNINAIAFVGDIIPGKIITVQTSDDDYQTWSTPKTVDLGMDWPNMMNVGTFRRRAWRITSNDYLPFRMQYMELQTDIGGL